MEPIRVLQISYDMSLGGAETLIMNIYRHIDRSKVQFDFLLHNPEKSAYEDEISALGGRIYRIPRFKGYNFISYKRDLSGFLKAHPEHRVIHDHLMDSASETLKIAKRFGRIAVAHSHIADVPFSAEEFLRSFYRKDLWRISDYRFACSQAAGQWLYRGKADFTIARNGIDTSRFQYDLAARTAVRKEFGINPSTKLIGTVGRMVEQKNQLRLLGIFAEYCKKEPDSALILIGDGPLKDQLEKRIEELNLNGKAILAGTRFDVNRVMMAMDCFVLTSLNEGLGIVLVEAQATGLSCVFTDTIPSEVNLIGKLIHRVSLDDSDDTWAKTISNSPSPENRNDFHRIIKDKGYDIADTAAQLQNFYLTASCSADEPVHPRRIPR